MRVELTEPRASACDVTLDDGEQIFVGRSPTCEIHVPCKSVSKRHARLIRQGDQVVVEDLGSRNGLKINGVSIASAYLEPGDIIQVGRATLQLKGKSLVSSAEESGFRLLENEPDLQPRLVMLDDATSSFDLTESSTIGCRPENSICISALGVSRFHAEVVQQGDSWVIQDLGATNGVVVNGERVDSAVLQPGDEITIGDTRMRFELEAQPRSTLQRRLRTVLAAAVALLLCATGVSATTANEMDPALIVVEAGSTDLETGVRELIAGRYAAAQESLRAGENQDDVEARRSCRTLRKLAREFVRLEQKPDGLLWERAEELVDSASGMDLGPEADAWLSAKADYLAANRAAHESLSAALDIRDSAQQETELELALDAFMDAALRCEGIAAEAHCFARAKAAAVSARALAVARISVDLRGLGAQSPPAWSSMEEVAGRGLEFTKDVQERLVFRQLIGRCQREQAAANSLGRAQEEFASGRQEAGLRELERIPSTSYYAAEKTGLIQRGELRSLLERAQHLYARGSGQQARDVLDEAFDLDQLPIQFVQREVGALRQGWVRVEREFMRGTRAAKGGDRVLARDAFAEVLRLEPDPTNRFHTLALEQLSYLQAAIRDEIEGELRNLDRALELPLEALHGVELAEVAQRIRRVQDHPAATQAETSRIQSSIKLLALRLDARDQVKAALFRNDAEALERLGSQLAFLDTWLPDGASEREGLDWAQDRLSRRLAQRASTRRLTRASK